MTYGLQFPELMFSLCEDPMMSTLIYSPLPVHKQEPNLNQKENEMVHVFSYHSAPNSANATLICTSRLVIQIIFTKFNPFDRAFINTTKSYHLKLRSVMDQQIHIRLNLNITKVAAKIHTKLTLGFITASKKMQFLSKEKIYIIARIYGR
jgi:hypothetical protein